MGATSPRLPVSGSDAHCFVGDKSNNKRGYGDFPSGKVTWIKADPTWLGLLQAIKEPKKRCFIGTIPPKVAKVNDEKSYYIERIILSKEPDSPISEAWFDGCCIELNTDLVAIIGNKGSGKSALADAIALLGQSQEKSFSFLKKERFRGRSGEPARHFTGLLFWKAGGPYTTNLSVDPPSDKVELVKYIPQGRFEALCNDHVSGSSGAFENELRNAIFSHIPAEKKLGALSFEQLTEEQEKVVREKLNELRKDLRIINAEIVSIEDQLHVSTKRKLRELLALKQVQLQELQAAQPSEQAIPSEELTGTQKEAALKLETLAAQDVNRSEKHKEYIKAHNELATKIQAIKIVTEHLNLFEEKVVNFKEEISQSLAKIGLTSSDIVNCTVNRSPINTKKNAIESEIEKTRIALEAIEALRKQIEEESRVAASALNEPQRKYQSYLEERRQWTAKIELLIGDASMPESKAGLEARLEQINTLPAQLELLKSKRVELTRKIYNTLNGQRISRSEMYEPIQKLITDNDLIHKEYKLQFQANVVAFSDVICTNIFSVIKQNVGDFRGEEESRSHVKALYERFGCNEEEHIVNFITNIVQNVEAAAALSDKDAKGIRAILRKNRSSDDFYNYIFGLEFIETKYSLLFQGTPIEQLSPGQRGALLLIFYLLVDKSKTPIVLDQPEENLDNETIVSLLVPVIEEAKKNRQIIMVTHNPNLAVVCDAEQIIVANFERNNASKISYYTGSIEEAKSNKHIIDILEGTKRAFDNRSWKYFAN